MGQVAVGAFIGDVSACFGGRAWRLVGAGAVFGEVRACAGAAAGVLSALKRDVAVSLAPPALWGAAHHVFGAEEAAFESEALFDEEVGLKDVGESNDDGAVLLGGDWCAAGGAREPRDGDAGGEHSLVSGAESGD